MTFRIQAYCCTITDNLYFFRYMLTPGGREAARECLSRSGFADSIENVVNGKDSDKNERSELDLVLAHPDSNGEVTECFVPLSRKEKSTDVPFESLERV